MAVITDESYGGVPLPVNLPADLTVNSQMPMLTGWFLFLLLWRGASCATDYSARILNGDHDVSPVS